MLKVESSFQFRKSLLSRIPDTDRLSLEDAFFAMPDAEMLKFEQLFNRDARCRPAEVRKLFSISKIFVIEDSGYRSFKFG